MRKIVSLRQVVESVRDGGGGWELCATAQAKYDSARSTVVVELDSMVQPVDLAPGVDGFRQPWLPARVVVERCVPLTKARLTAQSLFRRWIVKVRRAIPELGRRSAGIGHQFRPDL